MARPAARTIDLLRDVIAQFDLRADAIHDIRAGSVNKHWRVMMGSDVYALRRYTERRSEEAIRFEHDVLAHLDRDGWPVAAPVRAGNGVTVVESGGRRHALFPFLPGRPAPYAHPRYLRFKGALLARLHRAMASWPGPAQRDGFGRVWELDTCVQSDRFRSFDEAIADFGRTQPALAEAVQAERRRNQRELGAVDWDTVPSTVIHFDFHHDNILFVRGTLTGLIDFDLVHVDARVADIASSITLDCLQRPDYNSINAGAAHAFVSGYVTETALTTEEIDLIVPLIRAQYLWLVAFRLAERTTGREGKAVASIQRSVTARFPNLDRDTPALEAAVLSAVAGEPVR